MADAYMESRVRIELESLSFIITVDEAEELFDQLQEILPQRSVVTTNVGGSFGFASTPNEKDNDE